MKQATPNVLFYGETNLKIEKRIMKSDLILPANTAIWNLGLDIIFATCGAILIFFLSK